ncbi:hypothetical protein FJZ48_03520, partial [Candidatus Uhrbacteria bacterium]|nr:hypothetical protein [Candidatus Uhrbacteria bacterium]
MKEFLSKMVRGAAILGALAGSANVAKAEKPASSEQQIDIHALAKSTVDQIMKIIDLPADKEAEGRKRIETLVTNTLKKTADLKPAQQAQALRQLVDKARE